MERREFLAIAAVALTAPLKSLMKASPEAAEKATETRFAEVLDSVNYPVRTDPTANRVFTTKRFCELKEGDLFRVIEPNGQIFKDHFEFWECVEPPVAAELPDGTVTWVVHTVPWVPPQNLGWSYVLPNGEEMSIGVGFTIKVVGQDAGITDLPLPPSEKA